MGGGRSLASEARARLGAALQAHPTTRAFLAYDGRSPIGVAVCFLGFSTFAARPLLNVHDLAVLPEHRRRGVGRALLEHVAEAARGLGCCKITLEVRADNGPAQALYRAAGFVGDACFLERHL
ncbi:MAG: GNAT family N-acetyltransferase [Deltaproteobacteria bacterium]|nr:GNAT family N-acetyltransferase [Deltaproteobacteria bacterium]